jgi:hypothetical protein
MTWNMLNEVPKRDSCNDAKSDPDYSVQRDLFPSDAI